MGSPSFLNLATRVTLYLASLVGSLGSLGTNCSNGTRCGRRGWQQAVCWVPLRVAWQGRATELATNARVGSQVSRKRVACRGRGSRGGGRWQGSIEAHLHFGPLGLPVQHSHICRWGRQRQSVMRDAQLAAQCKGTRAMRETRQAGNEEASCGSTHSGGCRWGAGGTPSQL